MPTTQTPARQKTQNGNHAPKSTRGRAASRKEEPLERDLLRALRAFRNGDFSARLPLDYSGVAGEIAEAFNDVVELNEQMSRELGRINAVVGKEGLLGQRATLRGASGGWASCIDSVNGLIADLVQPTNEVGRVIGAVASGDLSQKMTLENEGRMLRGEFFRTATVVNGMVEQLGSFASEVTRVAREVGTEGKLGGQAQVKGVAGTWKDLTDSVNLMAGNLTAQVRNIAEVTTAVAKGDLSKKITVDVKGEILQLKNTINTMVDQLNSFASEVTRVASEVGTEGKLGGQAQVPGVGGTWKDLTDNVNSMASNLTAQVRNIAEVATAVAKGDLTKKITVDVKGEILELKNTINTMADQLNSFASEVTRVAREVGTEGKLGGQAQVKGVAGTWKDLTDSVNSMASNLTAQVRNIAEVTTAVAKGDLSKKITVDVLGEILELKNTINTMVDQLRAFAAEVTRVAREVGTEGKLGGQAQVEGVGGTWKDLTDNVNFMASNLTAQVRNIADVTTAVATGDLSRKITVDVKGEILQLKNTINTMVDQLNAFASEVTRVAREVGTEGKLGGQAQVRGVAGTWKDLTDSVNSMAGNLTAQVRNIADVTTAVATGDLSKKITVDVKGEILELKRTINTMVDQLNAFASEVTRVAREVGTEGKLGGQAQVRGVAGTWKDLTDNVNSMATNLTNQVRGIAQVVTAVANGDLRRKLALEARGEIAELAETINSMTNTLAIFADQVTSVAREVGVEGKLGGQAKVPGAAGTWRDLTDNVNQLAGNLTTQVRAIGDVATAVTKGDLTRSITVEASGEVAALKDNINEMIRNLKDTTQKTTEQDWLKTNLAKFTRMLQGQRDLVTVAQQILSELAPLVTAQHGVIYIAETDLEGEVTLKLLASYAYNERKHVSNRFALGEGLIGQCAFEKQRILLTNVPNDYVRITSGLGEGAPMSIIVLPVLFEGRVNAVIELASFSRLSDIHQTFLDQLTESIGIVVNTIAAGMRTESLLKQSQSLTQELQSQQEELRETNERLERQATTLRQSEERLKQQQEELRRTNEQLGEKAKLLEIKNREVEFAKGELEEKAEQLSLTSKYKSEFLANMSHELRTPLNNLLILSKMLADNVDRNLWPKQIEFARTIHSSGADLLALINDILDLSKIESGTMAVDPSEVHFTELRNHVEQTFRHIAHQKGLEFSVELRDGIPRGMVTDLKRLQQVLKNLLSNAFKFTERGSVRLILRVATDGFSRDHEVLGRADTVLAFSVVDTGIGIAHDKQRAIFEAFQQADGTTSRKYGGTGLGLSISREIAHLLGGELRVSSEPDRGSNFTLYLPRAYSSRPSTTRHTDATRGLRGRPLLPAIETESETTTIEIADDRDQVALGDRSVLIVDEDPNQSRLMLDVAHELELKAIVATRGDLAIHLARTMQPSAVLLDSSLPDATGLVVLDVLKHEPLTRHIPISILADRDPRPRTKRMGARGFLVKPPTREEIGAELSRLKTFVERSTRTLLVIDGEDAERDRLVELLGGTDLEVHATANAEGIDQHSPDCIVIGVPASEPSLPEVLWSFAKNGAADMPPIVLDVRGSIPGAQRAAIRSLPLAIDLATSPEELVATTSLHLHRAQTMLTERQRALLDAFRVGAGELAGTTILVVDDDIRNIFAVTALLEREKASIVYAENGQDGLEMLERTPFVDVVLMDIMMPVMDGYEVMRRIRAQERFRELPIIALTAKAMRADRERCIAAGASDYIAKPVDTERLLSLLRVSLGR